MVISAVTATSRAVATVIVFAPVLLAWVPFRATSLDQTLEIWRTMLTLGDLEIGAARAEVYRYKLSLSLAVMVLSREAFFWVDLQQHAIWTSRIYALYLNPALIAATLAGKRIQNFGFSDNGFTEEYLPRVESVVRGEKPIVVIGVTAHAFTHTALTDNQFLHSLQHHSLTERFKMRYLAPAYQLFARVPLDQLARSFKRRRDRRVKCPQLVRALPAHLRTAYAPMRRSPAGSGARRHPQAALPHRWHCRLRTT